MDQEKLPAALKHAARQCGQLKACRLYATIHPVWPNTSTSWQIPTAGALRRRCTAPYARAEGSKSPGSMLNTLDRLSQVNISCAFMTRVVSQMRRERDPILRPIGEKGC
jgi:hypothetical protein